MRRRTRGETLVESALVTTGFLIMLSGIMDFGRLGFAFNSISFAARWAVRYATVHGSTSMHPATAADIKTQALNNITGIDTSVITVTTTWNPSSSPGSTVQVQVTFPFQPILMPISSTALTLQSTSKQIITQ